MYESCVALLQVWENWSVTSRMAQVPGHYIAAAALPAFIITILFYFDHNVSSQLAQQPEFNLTKPPAYAYDFMLLSVMVRKGKGHVWGCGGGRGRVWGTGVVDLESGVRRGTC
jgi:hypothetical protein